MDSSRISPTAHYTGMVWARNGLSHPALSASLKPALYWAAAPLVWATAPLVGGLSLDAALLQRHAIVDALLVRAIEERGVRQVVEIAAGMSARGLRFSRRYTDRGLVYVEGDLPGMVARKRAALEGAGLTSPRHHILHIDALRDDGPNSLQAATAGLLDRDAPTAVLTEGLVVYLDPDAMRGLWQRIARLLGDFPSGVFVSDLITDDMPRRIPALGLFFQMLSVIARGRINTHFTDEADAHRRLGEMGFDRTALHGGADWHDALGVPVGRRGDVQLIVEAWREAGVPADGARR